MALRSAGNPGAARSPQPVERRLCQHLPAPLRHTGSPSWQRCVNSRQNWPRAEGYVPATTLWWVDGTEYLGRVSIRHRLNPRLLEVSGHIGYDVRPSARRRGHATAMLRAALPVAAALGIDPVLVTCDAGNIGSLKVIEANGGKLENRRGTKLRFWIQAVARPGPGHPVAAPT